MTAAGLDGKRADIVAVVTGHPVLVSAGPASTVADVQAAAVEAAGYDHLPGQWETRTGHGHLLDPQSRLDSPYDCSYCTVETCPPWEDGRVFVTLRAGVQS